MGTPRTTWVNTVAVSGTDRDSLSQPDLHQMIDATPLAAVRKHTDLSRPGENQAVLEVRSRWRHSNVGHLGPSCGSDQGSKRAGKHAARGQGAVIMAIADLLSALTDSAVGARPPRDFVYPLTRAYLGRPQ